MLHLAEALTVEGLSLSFPGREVLREVSFSLAQGAFCGLIGSNGSGKTTLLRTILGFQAPQSGEIRIGGIAGPRGRSSVGYVPQKILLDPDMPLRARAISWHLGSMETAWAFPSRPARALGVSTRCSKPSMPKASRISAWAISRVASNSGC